MMKLPGLKIAAATLGTGRLNKAVMGRCEFIMGRLV